MYFEMDSKQLKNVVDLLCCMAKECKINASKEGIKINLADGGNVALTCVDIKNTAFKRYVCAESESYGIDLLKMQKTLNKTAKLGNTVTVSIKDTVLFARGIYSNETNIISPDRIRKEPRIPDHTTHLNNKFIISSSNLLDTFNCFDSSHIRIKNANNQISMRVVDESKDKTIINNTKIVFNDEVTIVSSADATSLYSMDYILPSVKVMARICDTLSFEFGQDWPCVISNVGGNISFIMMLAPRIKPE